MKRFLGLSFVLLLLLASSPLGRANAAGPKVGSKCTKLNQILKASEQNFKCTKSGKQLIWVKINRTTVVLPKKKMSTPSKSPSPKPPNTLSQTNIPAESRAVELAIELPLILNSTPPKSSNEVRVPTPQPGPAVSDSQAPSNTSATNSSPETAEPEPDPSPSPSPSASTNPGSNIEEKFPISLGSPKISGIRNGAVPSVGQVLTCADWRWDQVIPRVVVSWIAYPSNTGSDIIDPKFYTTLGAAEVIENSKLEISISNINKLLGNYLYCFVTAKTAGGLETTSIAALLLGK